MGSEGSDGGGKVSEVGSDAGGKVSEGFGYIMSLFRVSCGLKFCKSWGGWIKDI